MATRRASLSEMLGTAGANAGGLSLKSLPDILGEAMPELPRDAVGRHRLVRALQQRFGANFRTLPGVKDLISQFDGEIEFENKVRTISSIKLENFRGKSK